MNNMNAVDGKRFSSPDVADETIKGKILLECDDDAHHLRHHDGEAKLGAESPIITSSHLVPSMSSTQVAVASGLHDHQRLSTYP